jgi:hypothetical protein
VTGDERPECSPSPPCRPGRPRPDAAPLIVELLAAGLEERMRLLLRDLT